MARRFLSLPQASSGCAIVTQDSNNVDANGRRTVTEIAITYQSAGENIEPTSSPLSMIGSVGLFLRRNP
ncbi:hypothetical protein K439DRAFT_1638499, partial [Ramaria rubella]